jgi:hypothetical protein
VPLHDHRCTGCGEVHSNTSRPLAELNKTCSTWPRVRRGYGACVPSRSIMGFVQKDICYDSPVDGRPITNKFARLDDLRRNDCVPYEPGMRQDADRARRDADAALDRAVDSSVDQFVATAPAGKVEKLAQELHAGASVEVTRASPAGTN